MKTMALTLALIGVAMAVAIVIRAKTQAAKGKGEPPKARRPLTKNEQPMYFRLRETFPEHVVLAQVAFSALVTARSTSTRNKFDRKVADFVLCTKAFEVLAVIELDDASHRDKKEADKARDSLLKTAGYNVLRFQRVPDAEELHAAFEKKDSPTDKVIS